MGKLPSTMTPILPSPQVLYKLMYSGVTCPRASRLVSSYVHNRSVMADLRVRFGAVNPENGKWIGEPTIAVGDCLVIMIGEGCGCEVVSVSWEVRACSACLPIWSDVGREMLEAPKEFWQVELETSTGARTS